MMNRSPLYAVLFQLNTYIVSQVLAAQKKKQLNEISKTKSAYGLVLIFFRTLKAAASTHWIISLRGRGRVKTRQ